ncbi:uncharacterized protein EURHEDRAFT_325367 [Aspergillus ruber CBS 135680]|uniref:Uncharacterized protein n=1 Tax=Aspergillus ruber (strain CBS 135680) TaxID=1388766 RepID=A0A017SJY6_ASPRC|nr:uncharacterized protein EURHEDRAFT_325367 [Aspergillus ruber CBS 135680]EYE97257.1 hypothetical protein EURHEDRAFT_325367 [Aspergillus ruber CBS 135680]
MNLYRKKRVSLRDYRYIVFQFIGVFIFLGLFYMRPIDFVHICIGSAGCGSARRSLRFNSPTATKRNIFRLKDLSEITEKRL